MLTTASMPPKRSMVARKAPAMLSRDVKSNAVPSTISFDDSVAASFATSSASLRSYRHDDVGAALGSSSATSRPMPLAPPTTTTILRLNSRSGGMLQLGFFERPFDLERLGPRQCDVVLEALELGRLRRVLRLGAGRHIGARGAERIGARHHVNRVDEELGRDARFALVLAETEESEPGMTTTDGFEAALANPAARAPCSRPRSLRDT